MIDMKGLTDAQVDEHIWKIKEELGDGLFVPVHHYQRDEVVQFADCIGDSLELSRVSADTPSRCILFCGVYFMAEIARTLAAEDQQVYIPNPSAGCPLADFAFHEDVEYVWELLQELHHGEYVPVTYANSHIEVKAFCGSNGGFVCTSSNTGKIFSHILLEGKRVFFLPDRNLGLNTAAALGMEDSCCIVDRHNQEILRLGECRIVVWNGFCVVHRAFTLSQVKGWRMREPEARIIVHPECDPDVVEASDYSGSTSKIKTMVEGSPEGSKWVIGTEYNMVQRLKRENPGKLVEPLEISICENMSKNSRRDLLDTLIAYRSGDSARQVILPDGVKENALRAISRMLQIS
jgi:quinolinate synthase